MKLSPALKKKILEEARKTSSLERKIDNVEKKMASIAINPPKTKKKKNKQKSISSIPAALSNDANTTRWLSMLADPLKAAVVGVVPPFGHFNESWWVTRRNTAETTITVPAGAYYYFGMGLGASMPLNFRSTTSFPVAFPTVLSSTVAANTSSLGVAVSGDPAVQQLYRTWYDQLWNQGSIPAVLQGAVAAEQMIAPAFLGTTPLPLVIPLVAYLSLECTTSMINQAGTMYADVVTPSILDCTSASDTSLTMQYTIGNQQLQASKHKANVVTGSSISSMAVCDETVFSNAVPMGVDNALSGSSRGLAWIGIQNASGAPQTFTLRASYIYMIEPLATSGLFDLAVRPKDLIATQSPIVAATHALTQVQSGVSLARAEAGNVMNLAADVARGDIIGGFRDAGRVISGGSKIVNLFKRR